MIEQRLREVLHDLPVDLEQQDRLLASAVARGRRARRRRRAGLLAVAVPALAAGAAGTVVAVQQLQPGAGADQISAPVGGATAEPVPSQAAPKPGPDTVTAPPFRYQAVPGLSGTQAAAVVDRCVSWQQLASPYLAPAQARLRVVARDRVGSTVIIDGPVRASAQPPAGYRPLPTRTMLVECQLLPDGRVDTIVVQQLHYRDDALPAPVLIEFTGGGITRAAYTKATGDFNVPWLWTIGGRVSRNVTRVVWTTPDGQHVPASIGNGYFIARAVATDRNASADGLLTSYDDAGHVLDARPLNRNSDLRRDSGRDSTAQPATSWP